MFSSMSGPNSSSEWSIEGRRLVPLMPRLVPQTAFTVTANAVANATAIQNASLLLPAETGNKEGENRSVCAPFILKIMVNRQCMNSPICSGCLLLLHKHHLHAHQCHGNQRGGYWYGCEVTTATQSFIQRCGAAQRQHSLRKKSVPEVATFL